MRNNSKGFAPILILILVVLVGLGVYYFGTQKGKNTLLSIPTPTSASTLIVVATPSPASVAHATPSVSADWKTFTDNNVKISFKYPSDWTCTSNPGGMAGPDIVDCNPSNISLGGSDVAVGIMLDVNDYAMLTNSEKSNLMYTNQRSPITSAGMEGVSVKDIADDGGVYILNHGGNALQFGYGNINGISYGSVAEQMMKSVVLAK